MRDPKLINEIKRGSISEDENSHELKTQLRKVTVESTNQITGELDLNFETKFGITLVNFLPKFQQFE